ADRKAKAGLTPEGDVPGELSTREALYHRLVHAAVQLQARGQTHGPLHELGVQEGDAPLEAARHRHAVHAVERATEVGRQLVSGERRDGVARDEGFREQPPSL